MNSRSIVPFVFMLAFSGPLFPAEPMSGAEIKNHVSRVYFRGDGTATRLTPEGDKIQGNWHVTDTGQHCVDWGEHGRCTPVVEQGNGTYQKIEEGFPRAEFTVIEANPEGL